MYDTCCNLYLIKSTLTEQNKMSSSQLENGYEMNLKLRGTISNEVRSICLSDAWWFRFLTAASRTIIWRWTVGFRNLSWSLRTFSHQSIISSGHLFPLLVEGIPDILEEIQVTTPVSGTRNFRYFECGNWARPASMRYRLALPCSSPRWNAVLSIGRTLPQLPTLSWWFGR